ncbi:IS6 family transposase [Agrobacterium sp. 22-226-1]
MTYSATRSPQRHSRPPAIVWWWTAWRPWILNDSCTRSSAISIAPSISMSEKLPLRSKVEVVISIGGKKHWLWRAVDQDGFVLDVLVQSRRNTKAAKRLMRKLLKGQGQAPRVMITGKLRSYGAAKRDIMPGVEHRSHKGLNNRAENSHQPTRRRERIMKGFKSARHLQRFVSIHDPVANLFHIPRHDIPSHHHRELRTAAMQMWSDVARLQAA